MRHLTTTVLLLLAVTMIGCRTTSESATKMDPQASPAVGDIVASPSGESLDFDELTRRLLPMRAVFVGESHNNDFHHALQLRVVKAMHAQNPKLMIGMEMFQRPYQEGLDRFLAGATDEATFLKETEYFTRWQWDFRYYRPILEYAREHGLKVIALNSPKELNRKVSRGGGIPALTEEDYQWVARDIDLNVPGHREFVMAVFERHPMMPGFDKENYYASQCVWEDTMAESTARALDQNPGSRIVVIVGSGHVRKRYGIPIRAERRGATPYSIVVGMDLDPSQPPEPIGEMLTEDLGDFLVFTPPAPTKPPSPKIGVMLDDKSEGTGILVKGVTAGSVAGVAGVKKDDRITGLSGSTIATLEDLRIALALHTERMGTIEVLRGEETLSFGFDFRWAQP